ncbi:hypothetical protein [Streptomyces marokkonensis]|uniref:hypothetical protein n=1 Tax=Streptomyces marokkonensis TaxID=324855 RepID=UPI003CCAF407
MTPRQGQANAAAPDGDGGAPAITLFSDLERDEYRERCTRPSGKPIALPEPFAFDLDTGDFL